MKYEYIKNMEVIFLWDKDGGEIIASFHVKEAPKVEDRNLVIFAVDYYSEDTKGSRIKIKFHLLYGDILLNIIE